MSAARDGYRPFREGVAAGLPPEKLFALFGRFRVLCAHRQDVLAINQALSETDPAQIPIGTPVMVVRNDPLLHLYNGDIGLALPDPGDGILKVCFPGDQAGDQRSAPRWISLARLPSWEAAWAMTVHKSQGSEFERVMLVLPAAISAVTTRELLYTGITRAREHVSLWATESVVRAAIEHRVERMSGLRDKLRNSESSAALTESCSGCAPDWRLRTGWRRKPGGHTGRARPWNVLRPRCS